MISPVAVSSKAYVIAHENQYIHPMANPKLGSTNREAYDVKAPEIGIYVAISPREVMTE